MPKRRKRGITPVKKRRASFELRQGLFFHTQFSVDSAQTDVCRCKIGIEFESLLELVKRLGVLARVIEDGPGSRVYGQRERIDFFRPSDLSLRFKLTSYTSQRRSPPLVSERIVWIDVKRSFVLPFRSRPVPLEMYRYGMAPRNFRSAGYEFLATAAATGCCGTKPAGTVTFGPTFRILGSVF